MASDDLLERSLRLLDDATGSPSTSRPSFASPMRHKPRQRKYIGDTYDSPMADVSTMRKFDARDLSITMNTGELNELYERSPNTSGRLFKSDISMSRPTFAVSRGRDSDLSNLEMLDGTSATLTGWPLSNEASRFRMRESDVKNLSLSMNPGELTEILDGSMNTTGRPALKEVSRLRVRESDVRNLSLSMNPGELTEILDGSMNTTGHPALKEESEQLYRAFLDSVQNHQSTGQVFDTVANFAQNCSNVLDIMRENYLKGNKSKFFGFIKDSKWLEMERNNWRLLYCLYQNRLNNPNKDLNEGDDGINMETGDIITCFSEKEIVQNLYKMDNGIRECQLVVDWLEKNAADEYEGTVKPRLGHYMDKTVAWENTLHQLQNKDIVYASSRPIISSLDPDAPLRHGERGHLHDLDIEDESRLLEQVFFEIRCGRLEKAQELCTHCGQAWRAATLEGWKLHHDPNYSNKSKLEKLAVEGNPNRDIWKLLAWRLAEDHRAPVYARSIHGILCGNLASVLPVCKGWEDFLWAYTRVLIDNKVEREIRSNVVKQYAEMPDSYWNLKISLPDIFLELAASKQPEIRQDAQSPERTIQKLLILNKIPELMTRMLDWIKTGDCKPQLIRFFAHLVLTLRMMGQGHQEDKGNEILKAYVQVLMQQRDPQLVAYYTATLPQDDQITLYADFLESITDSNERRNCLEAAELVELEVEAITQRVVENIRFKELLADQLHIELTNKTTEEDLEKISALEWVVMYPQQRAEALWQTNAVIRRFLTVGKIEAARMAFTKIPVDSIEMILTQYNARSNDAQLLGYDNLPIKVAVSLREFLCHKAYLDAQEGFSDWFHHYHNAKPKAPSKPKEGASFTDKVAYDHRLAQYNKELDRWKVAMSHQTKSVKAQLYNVLVFPEGGWLVDLEMEDALRQQQMKSLRSLCIPKIVLLLHTVLHSMGEHTESLQLADLIVTEQYKIYQVYKKQQLHELLAKLSESSLALLDQGKDPWGCPVTS